ncbi:hypothetical protein SRHO_G00142160 [Serrasalmus rhombeus]
MTLFKCYSLSVLPNTGSVPIRLCSLGYWTAGRHGDAVAPLQGSSSLKGHRLGGACFYDPMAFKPICQRTNVARPTGREDGKAVPEPHMLMRAASGSGRKEVSCVKGRENDDNERDKLGHAQLKRSFICRCLPRIPHALSGGLGSVLSETRRTASD